LADAWPAEGPPVLWTRALGQGHSGLIVVGNRCFTQYQSSRGQFLLCLEMPSGATVWEVRYDSSWQSRGAYPGPYGSPTWADGRIFCSSPAGIVACFDADTGASLWSLNVREKFSGRGCEFGYAITPLIEQGKVIVPVGGPNASLVALSVSDGRTLWTSGNDPASYCPAFPITLSGRRCIVGYLQNSWILVEAETGKQLHRQSLSAGYDEHSAWPLYREPHLLLTTPFRQPANQFVLQFTGKDAIKTSPRWSSPELSNDVVSSVLYRDHIFGFDLKQLQSSAHRPSRGTFRCLDWPTGKVRWSTDRLGQASVLAADGKLYLLNDAGELILARADGTAYHELGRIPLFADELCWTPPSLSAGRLLVRSPSRAICLYVGRPENLPRDQSTSTIAAPVSGWKLDSTWLATHERDYPNDAPTLLEMEIWFAACLGCFLAACLFAGLIAVVIHRLTGRSVFLPLFLLTAFACGFLGPNLLSSLAERCLFTWPVCLYSAFHGTVLAYVLAGQKPGARFVVGAARLTLLAFLLTLWGYFTICKWTGLFIGWSFLLGFLPAFPLTVLAGRLQAGRRWYLPSAVLTGAAFSAFFWSCHFVFWWKAR
jgi:outer membrane protein assembly factor BamB